MKDLIIEVLKELQIEDYLITESEVEAVELYFVKKNLDLRRMRNAHEFEVNVYRTLDTDGGHLRGVAGTKLYPAMTQEEIRKALYSAYEAAAYVGNEYYEFPTGVREACKEVPTTLGENLGENAMAFAGAAFAEDHAEEAFLNSMEIFAERERRAITASWGTEVSYISRKVRGEFVIQCLTPQDVETYQNFEYRNLDTEALRDKVRWAIELTKARAEAHTAPTAGKYRVILSNQYMRDLFSFYETRANAAYIYPGYFDWKVGTQAQGEKITGDPLSITLKASLPYSREGIPMTDRPLLEEGRVKTIQGSLRFADYLKTEPTGIYEDIVVAPGKIPLAELKKEPYLQVVNFSDFQMDPFTGAFGGEIRLAFLYDGEKVIPVTGGSMNGNLIELQDKMLLSSDMQIETGYVGPLAAVFPEVPVAGV